MSETIAERKEFNPITPKIRRVPNYLNPCTPTHKNSNIMNKFIEPAGEINLPKV